MVVEPVQHDLAAGSLADKLVLQPYIDNFQNKDEAFKEYYKNLNETVSQNAENDLATGKTLAASRETDKLSFSTLLGSDKAAEAFLKDVLDTANNTPFLYDDLTGVFALLRSIVSSVTSRTPLPTMSSS